MNAFEILFWNAMYWLLYLPISIGLYLLNGKGDVLGILLIGVIFTFVLTAYLLFQEPDLFESRSRVIRPRIEVFDLKQDKKPMEVLKNEETKKYFGSAEMRTDVNLSKLDVSDDDIFS